MYNYPVLFQEISNRETWFQIFQICDDQTGDLIILTDANGNALYGIYLEISPPRRGGAGDGCDGYYGTNGYYSGVEGEPIIFLSLSQGSPANAAGSSITIPDVGTIQVQIPYTVMQKLRGSRTFNVYLRLEDTANADARQLLIGKLPVAFGGHGP